MLKCKKQWLEIHRDYLEVIFWCRCCGCLKTVSFANSNARNGKPDIKKYRLPKQIREMAEMAEMAKTSKAVKSVRK